MDNTNYANSALNVKVNGYTIPPANSDQKF